MGTTLGVRSGTRRDLPRKAKQRAPARPETLQRPPNPAGAARRRALNTPEILEMILLHLDMRTLLTSGQRVCHTWTNLIRTSRLLQRALFFTPIKDSDWASEERTLNPLLAEAFPSIFPAKGVDDVDDNTDDTDDDNADNDADADRFTFCALPMANNAQTLARFVRRSASWRRMLIQQPPLHDIALLHICSTRIGDSMKRSTIPADPKHSPGLRMERLFELLLFNDGGRTKSRAPRRVYWAAEEPIAFCGWTRRIAEKFHRMLGRCGVLVFSYTLVQCRKGVGRRAPWGLEEHMRRKILRLYEKEQRFQDDEAGKVDQGSSWWDYALGPSDGESEESDGDTKSIEGR
ncbi:hypothetical protein BJY00DRAFT_266627 [Aspergillus carlsbadensis]|nr:hypothetical protein BJY00DRAFT_266627 [Aspergillus carlsbadensis]